MNLIPGVKFVKCNESCGCCGGVRAGVRPFSYTIAGKKTRLDERNWRRYICYIMRLLHNSAKGCRFEVWLLTKVYNVTDLLAMSYRAKKP